VSVLFASTRSSGIRRPSRLVATGCAERYTDPHCALRTRCHVDAGQRGFTESPQSAVAQRPALGQLRYWIDEARLSMNVSGPPGAVVCWLVPTMLNPSQWTMTGQPFLVAPTRLFHAVDRLM
jgi:hypothetical protein